MIEDEDEPTPAANELRSYVAGFAWVIGLFLAAYLIGFLISTPLFVVVYMITHGRTFWASCITAVVMGGAIYGASIALQMYLFPGILFAG
jgi:heme/copper-type cytochrome/quinol oxidase subunit 4